MNSKKVAVISAVTLALVFGVMIHGGRKASAASTVVVKPTAMNGWYFWNDFNDTLGGPGALVSGPATAPLGTGSVELGPLTAASGNGAHSAIATDAFSGVPLTNFTSMSYSTYQPGPVFAIALQFDVRYRPTDVAYGGRLVFEPYQNGAVIVGSGWGSWSPLAGKWWASKTTAAGSNGACPQASPCTWSQLQTLFPNAIVAGRFLLKAGSNWNGFDGNADNLTVGVSGNDTTYDFEPTVQCTTDCYVATTGNNLNGGTGPGDEKLTIQAAVNQVSAGGTVHVAAGTYTENVAITKSLVLNGAQAGNPVSGRTFGSAGESTVSSVSTFAGNSGVFIVSAADVTIDGFSVTNAKPLMGTGSTGSVSGIVVKTAANPLGGNNAQIKNNILDTLTTPDTSGNGTCQAIYLEDGPDNVQIVGNVMNNVHCNRSAKGVLIGDNGSVDPSTNTLIQGNSISLVTSDTRGAYAVLIGNGNGATANSGIQIKGNTIGGLSGGGWVHAIGVEANAPAVLITDNAISSLSSVTPAVFAVWFESEDTSFPNGLVNNNRFDVGSAAYGIAVDPALSGGPVDGTCNWWGDSSGPGAIATGLGSLVSTKVNYTPWQISASGPCTGKPTTPVSINNIPGAAVYAGSFTPTYTSLSTGAKSASTTTPSTCTVSGGIVNFVGAGTCTLVAHADEDANYAASDGSPQSFSISQAATTISINNIPTGALSGGNFMPTYAYTGDGVTSVTSSTPNTCSVSGATVNFIDVGICTLTAHATAGTNYAATNGIPQSFTIGGARTIKQNVLVNLAAISGDKKTDKAIAEAIKLITNSLQDLVDKRLWIDDNRIDGKQADKIFGLERDAVRKLMDIKNEPPAVDQAIQDLVLADSMIAQTAINDIGVGGDPKKVADANKEMAKAQEEINKGHFDAAIDHFRNAWKAAQKA